MEFWHWTCLFPFFLEQCGGSGWLLPLMEFFLTLVGPGFLNCRFLSLTCKISHLFPYHPIKKGSTIDHLNALETIGLLMWPSLTKGWPQDLFVRILRPVVMWAHWSPEATSYFHRGSDGDVVCELQVTTLLSMDTSSQRCHHRIKHYFYHNAPIPEPSQQGTHQCKLPDVDAG